MAIPTKSYKFDGVNENVIFSADAAKIILDALASSGKFAVSFWAKSSADATSVGIFGLTDPGGGSGINRILIEFRGSANPNKLRFRFEGDTVGDFIESAGDITNDDTWFHILARYDGSTMDMLINNVIEADTASVSTAISYDSIQELYLGSVKDGSGFANANILEVAVFDYAPTDDEASEIFFGLSLGLDNLPTAAAPIFYPPCDELTVFDHAYEVINGDAADFDGVNEHVAIGKKDNLINFGTGDFKITVVFFSPAPSASFRTFYSYGDTSDLSANPRIDLSIASTGGGNSSKFVFSCKDSSAPNQDNLVSDNAVTDTGLVQTVVCERISGENFMTINGVQQAQTPLNDVNLSQSANGTAFIGQFTNSNNQMNAKIGSVEVEDSGVVVSKWNLGRADTFPTAKDSVGSNDGTYTNMEAVNLGTFFGGLLTNMESGDIEEDVPVDSGISNGLRRGNIFMGSGKYNEPFINTQRN